MIVGTSVLHLAYYFTLHSSHIATYSERLLDEIVKFTHNHDIADSMLVSCDKRYVPERLAQLSRCLQFSPPRRMFTFTILASWYERHVQMEENLSPHTQQCSDSVASFREKLPDSFSVSHSFKQTMIERWSHPQDVYS